MKVRNGFVSNSSSSSFVVVFPEGKPKKKAFLQDMLFGDADIYQNPYSYNDEQSGWPVSEVTKVVWDDMKKPATVAEIANIRGDFLEQYNDKPMPKYPSDTYFGDKSKKEQDEWQEKYDFWSKEASAWEKKAAENFVKNMKKSFGDDTEIYIFEYEDHTSLGSAMEHGDLFRNFKHYRISHH